MRVTRSAAKRAATTPTETSSAPLISPQSKKQRTTKNSQPANSSQPAYYLFKSEPESRIQNGHEMKYSIDDLSEEKDAITHWDGVRNAEARNCMLGMHVGDFGFFYHSNTKKSRPAIVGIVKVVKEAYPGMYIQLDFESTKSLPNNPNQIIILTHILFFLYLDHDRSYCFR